MNERKLSFWGWGFADKFPDDEARKTFGDGVRAMLGFDELTLHPAPRLADLELPPPRIRAPSSLDSICAGDVRARATHSYGKSYRDLVRGFFRDFSAPPDLVASPRSEEDIARVLEWASAERIAVIPFGGGTSVVGGVESRVGGDFAGVVSLDLRALDRVLEVDPISRTA